MITREFKTGHLELYSQTLFVVVAENVNSEKLNKGILKNILLNKRPLKEKHFHDCFLKGSSDAKFPFTCCLNINVCW